MDSGLNTPQLIAAATASGAKGKQPPPANDWVFATPEKPISKSNSIHRYYTIPLPLTDTLAFFQALFVQPFCGNHFMKHIKLHFFLSPATGRSWEASSVALTKWRTCWRPAKEAVDVTAHLTASQMAASLVAQPSSPGKLFATSQQPHSRTRITCSMNSPGHWWRREYLANRKVCHHSSCV